MSGLELLRMFGNDVERGPGIMTLLGLRMVAVDEGRVTFEMETRPEFGNPLGGVAGGIISTIVDAAMACAVHSALPPRASYATVDLGMTFLKAVPHDGRTVRAEGRVLHVGGRIATADGRVVDGEDRLVATATTTCMVFRN